MSAANKLLSEATRLQSHPAFLTAVQTYCVELAKLREAPRLLNAIISTDVRWRIVGYLLYLASDTERFGPQGGATYGRLLGVCVRRKEASPRALKTLLGLLKLSSLVSSVSDAQDGRIRYYQPTERMNAFLRGWLSYAAAALDRLEPALNRTQYIDDPAFRTRFNVSGGRAHLSDETPLIDHMPEPLRELCTMSGAFSVIAGVMEADLSALPTPPIARLAYRFGLSRTQVRNVVSAGQAAGLLAADPDGRLVATLLLQKTFYRWIAIELAFYAEHMRAPDERVLPVRDEFYGDEASAHL